MKTRIYLYTRFERFWHWCQALLIIFLLTTGFEMHGTFKLLGYEEAYAWHVRAGWALLGLSAFAIFWHFTTGQWRHYLPGSSDLKKIIRHYLSGIFQGEPHPFCKSPEHKLNPLQAWSYLFLKLILLPGLLAGGLALLYYRTLADLGILSGLGGLALFHTALAYAMILFLLVHLYMATTGETVTQYLTAMITGWEESEGEAAG
jgi:thiosulfate reductase cytochrome b subunit